MAYHGRLKEADRLSERAVNLSRQAGLMRRAASFKALRRCGMRCSGTGRRHKEALQRRLSLFRSRDADYGPAFALALLGDLRKPMRSKAELEKRYPQDTSVQFSYLPVLRALEALNQDDPAKALEMTQAAAPYDLAVPGTAYFTGAFFGALYPVYVRGLAYSRMGRPARRQLSFKKFSIIRYITLNDPIGPMARLQLARALSASGDRAKSAAAYKDLLGSSGRTADLRHPRSSARPRQNTPTFSDQSTIDQGHFASTVAHYSNSCLHDAPYVGLRGMTHFR